MIADGTALDTGILILRLVLGLTLTAHGLSKFFGKAGIDGVARWMESIGIRPGKPNAIASAGIETAAGLGIAAGFLTPVPAAGFVALMLVAVWTDHRRNGFFNTGNGWEYNLVLATGAVALATIGAGVFSADGLIFGSTGFAPWLSGWNGLLLAVGLGVFGGVGQLLACYRPTTKPAPST